MSGTNHKKAKLNMDGNQMLCWVSGLLAMMWGFCLGLSDKPIGTVIRLNQRRGESSEYLPLNVFWYREESSHREDHLFFGHQGLSYVVSPNQRYVEGSK